MPERPRSKSAGTRSAVGLNYQKGSTNGEQELKRETGGQAVQPIVSQGWPHPKLDAHIKPQPTNEKCWRQTDRRIKSDQPIRESRVFRAQTARQLANQRKQGLSRPNYEAAGSDYKKAPPRRLRQTTPDSARFSQTPPGISEL